MGLAAEVVKAEGRRRREVVSADRQTGGFARRRGGVRDALVELGLGGEETSDAHGDGLGVKQQCEREQAA